MDCKKANLSFPTVLCVDDDDSILMNLQALLTELGYEVITASSAWAALDYFIRRRIDVVVLDYEMPGADGVQLALSMQMLKPSVPKLMFSSATRLPRPATEVIQGHVDKLGGVRALVAAMQRILTGILSEDPDPILGNRQLPFQAAPSCSWVGQR